LYVRVALPDAQRYAQDGYRVIACRACEKLPAWGVAAL